MQFFADWKFWIFAVSICQTGLMVYGFLIIKYNDFVHLKKDVDEIIANVKEINNKVIKIDKELGIQSTKIKFLENAE